jgi:hypothetical protein
MKLPHDDEEKVLLIHFELPLFISKIKMKSHFQSHDKRPSLDTLCPILNAQSGNK